MRIFPTLSAIVGLLLASPVLAAPVTFSYTQTDATTGSGTITGNIDTTPVGGPGVLPFSGSLPLPAINQKDANPGVTLPGGIVGFLSAEGGPGPGTPNGVHLGWTGSVTLTAVDAATTYEIDVPLVLPSSSEPFSWSADLFDDNGQGNDAVGTTRMAGWVGDDGGGHRHTDFGTETWATGADTLNFGAAFNLGGDGQGDALGISISVRDGSLFPGGDPIFIDQITFDGALVADDGTLSATTVPEPASIAIWSVVGLGIIAFFAYRRRRQ